MNGGKKESYDLLIAGFFIMVNHCCSLMNDFLDDRRVQIFYSPQMREYYIPLKYHPAVQGIFYCPWCGKELPASLREKLYEILEQEYGIDPDPDFEKTKGLHKEFLTDEWWKKRGL